MCSGKGRTRRQGWRAIFYCSSICQNTGCDLLTSWKILLDLHVNCFRPARAKEWRLKEWPRLKIGNKCLKTLMKVIEEEFDLEEVWKEQKEIDLLRQRLLTNFSEKVPLPKFEQARIVRFLTLATWLLMWFSHLYWRKPLVILYFCAIHKSQFLSKWCSLWWK